MTNTTTTTVALCVALRDDTIPATIKGLDATGRLLRDMEADAKHLGLSEKDAAALRVASALLAAVLADIDVNSSRHTPSRHFADALAYAVGVKY